MDTLCLKGAGIHCALAPKITIAGNGELRLAEKPPISASRWGLVRFRHSLRALWSGGGKNMNESVNDAVSVEEKEGIEGGDRDRDRDRDENGHKGNWVLKIWHVNSVWKDDDGDESSDGGRELLNMDVGSSDDQNGKWNNEREEEDDDDCDVCVIEEDKIDEVNNRESFTKLLRQVPLEEARLYARMSYLGKLAYSIPRIKPGNLQRYHGLRLVTSSIQKKEKAVLKGSSEEEEVTGQHPNFNPNQSSTISTAVASTPYKIAASAASYLHSHAPAILHFRSSPKSTPDKNSLIDDDGGGMTTTVMPTTDSVTAVVAANEQVKQAVANDLNSTHSSPCEWFVCDDDRTATRFFIVQGSESLASWQANLLFEPIKFEELDDVLVHRGIYEAAKGIYDQMLPEIRAHLKCHGNCATFYFTGHSLGGSLSLLINLMLLLRDQVPRSSLLPVIIFGAPSIMCGGNRLLHKLGLPRNHVQSITMHRDIVPRAFSCHYPNHIAEFLKAININFRSLPCLKKQKLLYTPMGEFLILQPDHKFSPSHHLLPPGSGLYHLTCDEPDVAKAEKQIQVAQAAFLNSPHPLEILSDRSAYGSGGTIMRDHDMNSYLKSIRHIIRQELNRTRKNNRKDRRQAWWEVVAPPEIRGGGGVIFSKPVARDTLISRGVVNFCGVVKTGTESLKRFHRLIASQHIHLLMVLLFPARSMIVGIWTLINYQK